MHEDLNVRGRGHDDASHGPRLRAAGLDRGQLVPHLALPLRRGGLDHADRLGIVVIDETAAVGLNLGVAGGIFGDVARTTFTEETVGSVTQGVHRRAIEELVARDKNHPCVVLWSIANEPESHTEESRAYFEPLFAAARELDPTRPVGFVNMMLAPPDRVPADRAGRRGDGQPLLRLVPRRRRPRRGRARAWRPSCGRGPTSTTSRSWSPSTAPTPSAGLHTVRPVLWSEEYQADAAGHVPPGVRPHRRRGRASTSGTSPTSPPATSFVRVDGNKKGVFTRDRRPKAAAHHLRRRWRATMTSTGCRPGAVEPADDQGARELDAGAVARAGAPTAARAGLAGGQRDAR